jgi:hypothetical protein
MRKTVGVLSVLSLLAFFVPVRADEEDAKVREILARAIKAEGGIDNLKKYQGSVAKSKGKFYAFGDAVDYTGETSMQLPNRLRTEIESKLGGQDFKFTQIVDGDKGWYKIGDKTEELGKEMLEEAK